MIKQVICKIVKKRKIEASLSFLPPPPPKLSFVALDALKSQSIYTHMRRKTLNIKMDGVLNDGKRRRRRNTQIN